MRTSHAAQISFKLDADADYVAVGETQRRAAARDTASNDPVQAIRSGVLGLERAIEGAQSRAGRATSAMTAKLAGRLCALSVSRAEYEDLCEARNRYIERQMNFELDRSERARLTYIEWTLDRIEDAWHGPQIDKLEEAIKTVEALSQEIQTFHSRINPNKARR